MSDNALKILQQHAKDGAKLRELFFAKNAAQVVETSKILAASLARGGKLLFCGNGGSAADAQHLAAEFVNRFMMERPPLPAVALTTDTSALTAIGNDFGFEQIFSKQVLALGMSGDVLVAISTSGNSENCVKALLAAGEKGVVRVGLLGADGGEMLPHCDHALVVESRDTPLVQEVQIAVGHMLCRLVDHFLFEAVLELQSYLELPPKLDAAGV